MHNDNIFIAFFAKVEKLNELAKGADRRFNLMLIITF